MEVIQRLHSGVLDRRRPCWFCQLIEGLEGNRFALYNKIHHAYIDGMSDVKRMYGTLSTSTDNKDFKTTWAMREEKPKRRNQAGARVVEFIEQRFAELEPQLPGSSTTPLTFNL